MVTSSATRSPSRPWYVLAPLLVAGGAIVGHCFPEWFGREPSPPPPWREPAPQPRAPRPVIINTGGLASLAPIVEQVGRGVVSITTFLQPSGAGASPATDPAAAAGRPGQPHGDVPTHAFEGIGIVRGSGFVIHPDGLLITSHHVIAGHAAIKVDIPGQRFFDAEVIGDDPVADLAVLRLVDPPSDLAVLNLGDSSAVRQGDFVISISNPYEFHQSLAFGLVSYIGRHVPEQGMRVTNEYIQFTAAVNPGDSGAPVFDLSGNVIGVIRRTMSHARGISFAVPSKVVKKMLHAIEHGESRVRRGYIGIEFRPADPSSESVAVVHEGSGAEVLRVIEGEPAHDAGVQVGDVILAYNGRPVRDATDLFDRITASRPGTLGELSVLRGGALIPPMSVTIGEVARSDV